MKPIIIRSKPVTKEAMLFDGSKESAEAILKWTGKSAGLLPEVTPGNKVRLTIHTLEGDMKVLPGEYVIKGLKGEFYPCKPDVFQKSYNQVVDR